MARPAMVSLLLCMVLVLGGCATDRKVTLLYQPVVNAAGGTGELFLASSGGGQTRINAPVQWIVGKVKNGSGETIGDVVTRVPPESLVLDALKQELSRGGYIVTPVETMPATATKGVDLTRVSIMLNEIVNVVREEGTATVAMSVALWKDGREVKRLDYQTKFSDFTVADREQFAGRMLQSGLQEVMQQAVPEIIRVLEQ